MPKDTPQDHKAEALRWLNSDPTPFEYQVAIVHSNLAIAEGQERVAEALEGRVDSKQRAHYREALEEIAALTLDEGETNDNKVRQSVWSSAVVALDAPDA